MRNSLAQQQQRQSQHNGVRTSKAARYSQNNVFSMNSSATQPPAKQLGMTSAISFAEPSPADLKRTDELLKALESHGVFETEEELNHRVQVMSKLNTIFKQWIKEFSLAKNMSEAAAQKLGGKIYTFGSYRLGVHAKGSDIDAVCVAPLNIERADYFSSFFALLKKQPEVTECRAIEEAFVPVIKLNFDGIEIDLLFAKLLLEVIPDALDLCDVKLLRYMDEYSIRSLNGYRVTEEIQSLVPNLDTFRLTLRSIKLWAKKHGIYSNSLGYLGGVSWAILVARTCQLYPNATASTLVNKFFMIFARWTWPRPILLKHPDTFDDLEFPVWDPRCNPLDRYHLMPIVTPAYPQQNSTFNVLESTKNVMLMEFSRGLPTTDEIMLGKASWDRFFEAPSFFYKYRHFVVLMAHSKTADDHLVWCGFVESKIRKLVAMLERNQHISLAHVNPKCFDRKKPRNCNISSSENEDNKCQSGAASATGLKRSPSSPYCSMWFIGLEFQHSKNLSVNLTGNITSFVDQVMKHGAKIKMLNDGMYLDARYVKGKELSQYLDNDYLKRENENICSNAIKKTRKRPLSEMNQKDEGSDGSLAKKPRLSETVGKKSNALCDAGRGAPTLQQKNPRVNTAANKPQMDNGSDYSKVAAAAGEAVTGGNSKSNCIFRTLEEVTVPELDQLDHAPPPCYVAKKIRLTLLNNRKLTRPRIVHSADAVTTKFFLPQEEHLHLE